MQSIFAGMGIIQFNNADVSVILRNKTTLKKLLLQIVDLNGFNLERLSFIFCSDEFLLDINQQFLKHDFYTDVITFDLSDKKGIVNGEIYISIDRVKENAKDQQALFKTELHRVLFHGVLHLCGYKDKMKSDKLAMRTAEDFWLSNYFQ